MGQKYICAKCDEVFDEDEAGVIYETIGEGVMRGQYPAEACCPNCGSTEFDEARECGECGEYYAECDMIYLDNWQYCYECAKRIHEEYVEKWGKIKPC